MPFNTRPDVESCRQTGAARVAGRLDQQPRQAAADATRGLERRGSRDQPSTETRGMSSGDRQAPMLPGTGRGIAAASSRSTAGTSDVQEGAWHREFDRRQLPDATIQAPGNLQDIASKVVVRQARRRDVLLGARHRRVIAAKPAGNWRWDDHAFPRERRGPPPAVADGGPGFRASACAGGYRTRTVRFTTTLAPDLSVTVMVKTYRPRFTR